MRFLVGALVAAVGVSTILFWPRSNPPRSTDPPAPRRGALTDVSEDLVQVLDRELTDGACQRWNGGARDRLTELACGKWMFFHESFGTKGVPAGLVRFLAREFPDEWGTIADPASAERLPIGLAATAPLGGRAEALAFTCAACHFARLPDGRFAVGAPNHRFAYGKLVLALLLLPELSTGRSDEAAHDPAAVAAVAPLAARVRERPALEIGLVRALLPLLWARVPAPKVSRETEAAYARWPAGTMDFLVAPLALDDGVATVSKVSALWGIPAAEARLGWSGAVSDLGTFTEAFVAMMGGRVEEWPAERRAPLEAYVRSLSAPAHRAPPREAEVAAGRALFASRGCAGCHDDAAGGGRVFGFDEVGTDRAMARWLDPAGSGEPCCGVKWPKGARLTHGVKAPRLAGLWASEKFLHNGSVGSLERLFCLDGERGVERREDGLGDGGHWATCRGLDRDEKLNLISYLRSL
jgi:hypothetical protein